MIIKNGTIVTATDTFIADIKITGETITQIAQNIDTNNFEQVVDATNLYVMPGGVDVHTHLDLDVGIARAVDDFYTGTVAACCGGTTSIVDHMGFGPAGCDLSYQVNVYHELSKNKAVIDYGFHGVIQHLDEDVLLKMQTLIEEGITSYKFYLTYDYKLTDIEAFAILKRAKELGLIITVHPENDGAINYLKNHYKNKGDLSTHFHPKSRPEQCEVEAIERMIMFAKMVGDAPLYIVHLSNYLGLSKINDAKNQGQKNLFVETCPQYLTLDDSCYDLPNNNGLKYICSPPLRNKKNNGLLWRGIENNQIDTIATDHCPFNFNKEKQLGKDDFTKCPNGIPSIELRLPIIFSEGVSGGKISLNNFVSLVSTRPAKIFGLTKKGTIAPGFDADFVLIDPKKQVTVTKSMLHENVDYTPFEGMKLKGYPVMTISRGDIIVKDNNFIGTKGRGKFIKRSLFLTNS